MEAALQERFCPFQEHHKQLLKRAQSYGSGSRLQLWNNSIPCKEVLYEHGCRIRFPLLLIILTMLCRAVWPDMLIHNDIVRSGVVMSATPERTFLRDL